jgi:hypothetical protein
LTRLKIAENFAVIGACEIRLEKLLKATRKIPHFIAAFIAPRDISQIYSNERGKQAHDMEIFPRLPH